MPNKKAWKGATKLVEQLGNVLVDTVKWQPYTHGTAKEVATTSARVSKVLHILNDSSPPLAFHGHPPALAKVCLKLKVPANLLKLVLWMLPVASPAGCHDQDDDVPQNATHIHQTWAKALHVLWMLTTTVAFTNPQSQTLMAQFVALSEEGPPGELHEPLSPTICKHACGQM